MTIEMQQDTDRKALLNCLIRLRRRIKSHTQQQINVKDELHRLHRRKRLIEAQRNLFNRSRIAEMEKRITSLQEILAAGRESLARCGHVLLGLAPFVDQLLSFHDKCQVLGIGHIAASMALHGDTATQFEKMVFCHVLEYRGNEESYPFLDISMLFYIATFQRIIHKMKHNREMRQATTEAFKELFPDIATYQLEHEMENRWWIRCLLSGDSLSPAQGLSVTEALEWLQ